MNITKILSQKNYKFEVGYNEGGFEMSPELKAQFELTIRSCMYSRMLKGAVNPESAVRKLIQSQMEEKDFQTESEKINYLIERQLEQEEITRQNEESSLIEIDGMYYPKPERLLRNEDSNQKTSTNRDSALAKLMNLFPNKKL